MNFESGVTLYLLLLPYLHMVAAGELCCLSDNSGLTLLPPGAYSVFHKHTLIFNIINLKVYVKSL